MDPVEGQIFGAHVGRVRRYGDAQAAIELRRDLLEEATEPGRRIGLEVVGRFDD